MIIKNARVFQPNGTFLPQDIQIEGDKFSLNGSGEVVDAAGCYAIPGLVDIHFHGCVGYDFCDGTPEALSAIAGYEAKQGVAAICPATMTYPESKLTEVAKNAAAFQCSDTEAELVGINMEGPFISEAKKGAQNAAFLHRPDAEMFRRIQKAANGLLKLVDLAPEVDGAMECIHALHNDVRISIAHTGADYDTAMAAFAAGAKHVTHLYNAMPAYSHRAPGVIGAAADAAETVELICDGVHIHPAVVRSTLRMFGSDRVCFISDSMMATGLSDGEYSLGGQAVTVRGNLATLANGTIAGSATCLLDCVRTAVKQMGIPLGDAVKCASVNPAKAIGVYDRYGSITAGKLASFLLLDSDLNVKQIYLRGKAL